jgi:ATP-dependent protease HslVU (ClpYQ) peptidase subunit
VTALVGIARGGSVCIAADSAVIEEDELKSNRLPKVFRSRCGCYAVGCAGDVRVASILHETVQWPPLSGALARVATIDCVNAIRKALQEAGADDVEFDVLLGVRGHLYELGGKYDVIEPRPTWTALGTGAPWALGALDVLLVERPRIPLREVARRALRVAAARCCYVREPFRYVVV